MCHRLHPLQRPARRGKIERFTALPRQHFFAHFALLVTPREFDADGITQNVIVCACHIDIPAIAPDSGDELNLELKICGVSGGYGTVAPS